MRLRYTIRYALLWSAVTLFSVPVFAQSDNVLTTYCYRLADYQQDTGVNYTAGVSADGNAVVPADISAGPNMNTAFAVPLTIDLAERYGLPTSGLEVNATFGELAFDGQSRVTLNGQDITQQYIALCEGEDAQGNTFSTETVNEVATPSVAAPVAPAVPPVEGVAFESNIDKETREPVQILTEAPLIEGGLGQETLNEIRFND